MNGHDVTGGISKIAFQFVTSYIEWFLFLEVLWEEDKVRILQFVRKHLSTIGRGLIILLDITRKSEGWKILLSFCDRRSAGSHPRRIRIRF